MKTLCDFHHIWLQKVLWKFLFRCMGWFSLKVWEVLWIFKTSFIIGNNWQQRCSVWISFWVMITTRHSNTKSSPCNSERESFFFWIVPSWWVCCLYVWMTSTRAVTCTSVVIKWFAMYPSVSIMVLVHLFLFFAFIVTIQFILLLGYQVCG